MTLGQYLQGQINSNKKIVNFVEKCIPTVFRPRRKNFVARNDKKQSIALEILYGSITLRIDLRLAVQATEFTIGQGLYSRFGDLR